MRTCKKCGEMKSLEEFPLYSGGSGGRRYKCTVCRDAWYKAYYEANKERQLAKANAKYHAMKGTPEWVEGRQVKNSRQLARLRRQREEVYAGYGGKCSCCGESNPLFLTIDHVNSDGAEERRLTNRNTARQHRVILKENFPVRYQLLCFNCNCGRHRNGGICPHQEGSTTSREAYTQAGGSAEHPDRVKI